MPRTNFSDNSHLRLSLENALLSSSRVSHEKKKKTAFLDDFPLCPQRPLAPLQKPKDFIFIVGLAESLRHGANAHKLWALKWSMFMGPRCAPTTSVV